MFLSPTEYATELKSRIEKLKQELKELETTYSALVNAGIAEKITEVKVEISPLRNAITNSTTTLTQAEKIAESQRKRHRKKRDEKVPLVMDFLAKNGASTWTKLSKETKVTTDSLKLMFAENPDKFRQNPNNNLWELK